ncbi:MAG: hypothetical protein Fur0043_25600 [Anaerolineales bacterium]
MRTPTHAPPSSESLQSLEAHLAGTLRPVAPPPNIAHRLGQRIRIPEHRTLVSRLQDWRRLFVAFGSVMSGMVLVITLARAFYYVASRRQ